eukprot:TRINITY_DN4190_c0_g2_i1.p1 TRINITY_DN4190_c0_g2~~TRINITY_DN4190_c0_g2_i1.p1  ORF type:complete len:1284 (+),score=194.52 TRINITY_DN4190_c0_g2_i1:69-3920(+)
MWLRLQIVLILLLAWGRLCSSCDVDRVTVDVLKTLYNSCGGESWERHEGWMGETSVCTWEGISCAPSGACVVGISLPMNNLTGTLPASLVDGMIELLDVSSNSLTGTLPETYGELTTLNTLNVRMNGLSGTVPSSLFSNQFLNMLDLSTNSFDGFGDFTISENGTTLTSLNLSYNKITQIPSSLGLLDLLSSLILDGNDLHSATIPSHICSLDNLQFLSIQHSRLIGTLPDDIGSLGSLRHGIQLRNNSISGTIPRGIGFLAYLTYLDVSHNRLSGSIPKEVSGMASLRTVLLTNNFLTGGIPYELGTLSQMYYLDLSHNQFLSIPSSLGGIAASDIFLNYNNITGTIPESFSQLFNVRSLCLNNNFLEGTIPNLSSLTKLQHLYLQANVLGGGFPALPPSVTIVDVSQNKLIYWGFPMGDCKMLQSLLVFENSITGTIPESVMAIPSLKLLDLRNNEFEGTIPAVVSQLKQIGLIYLASNRLSGTIPDLGNMTSAPRLTVDFHSNMFYGTIPDSIEKLTNLFYLDLSENNLEGTIPACLGTMPQLYYLELSSNRFRGNLPTGLGSMRYLGAAANNLGGTVPPSIFSSTMLEYLSLEDNNLNGVLPPVSEMSALQYINLGRNSLTGCMPGGLKASALLLHSNKLQGSVPVSISASALLLHDNHLSCPLPNISRTPNVSIVLPGNEFTLPLPSWIVLHDAALLAVSSNPWHDYTWTWVAGGPAIIMVLCLFWVEKNKKPLAVIAGAFATWFTLLLFTTVIASKKFECGRIILRFSIAGIDSSSHTVLFIAFLFTVHLCVGSALVSIIVTSAPVVRKKKRRRKRRSKLPNITPSTKPSIYRKVSACVMFLFSAVLLCVPSALYSASHSLPPNNVLGWGPDSFYFSFFFTSVLTPFTVLVCVAVVVPKLSRVLLKFGWGTADPQRLNRTVWAIRVLVSFGIPIAVLLILDQGCGQMWTSLWCGCTNAGHCKKVPEAEKNVTKVIAKGLAPVLEATAKRLDYAPFSHGSVMRLAESASPCYTSRKKGVCTRRIIEVLSPLLLSKLVMATIVQPMSLVIQAYPYKMKYVKKFQKLIGGRQLSAATRLAELEGRLVWAGWLGFAAPPIMCAMLMVTCTLAGFLKRVQLWHKVTWTDVCAVDALPLFTMLVVCYIQAVAFWVDNEWKGTILVGVSPIPAAVSWALARKWWKQRVANDEGVGSRQSSPGADTLQPSRPADHAMLVPQSDAPQWDFLGVPCYGITSIMPGQEEDIDNEQDRNVCVEEQEEEEEGLEYSVSETALHCGSLNAD